MGNLGTEWGKSGEQWWECKEWDGNAGVVNQHGNAGNLGGNAKNLGNKGGDVGIKMET